MKKNIITAVGILLACSCFSLQACHSNKADTDLRKQVRSLHDTLMDLDGKAMSNKMMLDSVAKTMPKQADSAKMYSQHLGMLSDSMMDWMHHFDATQQGKSAEEANAYFTSQKAMLTKMDSSYKAELKTSGEYLKKCNMTPGSKTPMKMKM